jgi:GAF domain-containing protein
MMSRMELGPQTAGQLQDLLLSSPDFADFLEQLAGFSAAMLGAPGTVSCTVTVMQGERRSTVAGRDRLARELDEVQYSFEDGPCLCAIRTGMAVLIPDLAKEDRWPGFTAAVTDCGYRAMLAVPVPVDGNDGASLNFYARQTHAFSGDAMITAGGFAQIAATTLSLAAGLEHRHRSSEAVQTALDSRNIIARAVGILMDRKNCSQDAAFDMLRLDATIRYCRMLDVAETVIARAGPSRANPAGS